VKSEEELRQFFAGELAQHVEAWRKLRRIRPLGWVDALVALAALLMAAAMWRLEPLWLLPGYVVLRVMHDVRRVQSAFKQEVLRRVFEFALPGVQ
jgi:hypothetical protein